MKKNFLSELTNRVLQFFFRSNRSRWVSGSLVGNFSREAKNMVPEFFFLPFPQKFFLDTLRMTHHVPDFSELLARQTHVRPGEQLLPADLTSRALQLAPEQTFRPHQMSVEQFKRMLMERDEPERKRTRLVLNNERSGEVPKREEEEGAKLWDANYVQVGRQLPSTDTTLLVRFLWKKIFGFL